MARLELQENERHDAFISYGWIGEHGILSR